MFSFFKSKKFFFTTLISSALITEIAVLYYFFIIIPGKLPIEPSEKYLLKIQEDEIPQFTYSDKDFEEMKKTLFKEEKFLSQKIAYRRELPFGRKKLPASLIKESAQLLLQTLREARTNEELNKLIRERFIIYQAAGERGEGRILFTAYYTPIYEGSLKEHGLFRYPLYLKPKDLKIADLGEFDSALKGERILYRIDSSRGEIVPYWSRENIVKGKVLEGQNLKFIYLKDRIDRFFLMIEGSGKIVLENGQVFWVRYSMDNGRPYTSLAWLLAREEKIPEYKLSMEWIKQYFQAHPQKMDKYLNQNKRFIFFTKDEKKGGAIGATGTELTPKSSIAIDRKIFPLGAPAYIEYPQPEINKRGEVVGVKNIGRFVFCQDTGGVIKGSGRVDIYFGEGEEALAEARHLKGVGKLYFLIKKDN